MKMISLSEGSEWLKATGLTESPYSKPVAAGYYALQVKPPIHFLGLFPCMRLLLEAGSGPASCMIVITDSSSHNSDAANVLKQLWDGDPDSAALLFEADETAAAVSTMALILLSGMSAYIYSPPLTFYLWESELIDMWAGSQTLLTDLQHKLISLSAA